MNKQQPQTQEWILHRSRQRMGEVFALIKKLDVAPMLDEKGEPILSRLDLFLLSQLATAQSRIDLLEQAVGALAVKESEPAAEPRVMN